MGKVIVFCADGTWNGPEQDENADGLPDNTNVYKLFNALQGETSSATKRLDREQEKQMLSDGQLRQVAKYIHGVGDTHNAVRKLIGGAFGAGIIGRIVRGYTYISRNYEPGDSIVIVGFSRGAYTARALAGLILGRGLLQKRLTEDRERAYVAGAGAWYLHREKCHPTGFFERMIEAASNLPAFLARSDLKETDFVAVPSITAVGVWDTVGSLGIPNYFTVPGTDAFRFADTRLSTKVLHGFHAVSRDEQRMDFIPTLWDAAPNVEQVLFCGAHGDVGGGYPTTDNESGLSDIALHWLAGRLKSVGVQFADGDIARPFAPDPLGTAHKPWTAFPFNWPERVGPRLSLDALTEHESIPLRRGQSVVHHPFEQPSLYR